MRHSWISVIMHDDMFGVLSAFKKRNEANIIHNDSFDINNVSWWHCLLLMAN